MDFITAYALTVITDSDMLPETLSDDDLTELVKRVGGSHVLLEAELEDMNRDQPAAVAS